jgi:hypothetical protein
MCTELSVPRGASVTIIVIADPFDRQHSRIPADARQGGDPRHLCRVHHLRIRVRQLGFPYTAGP